MKQIGFIGAGKMAQAIINGMLKTDFEKPENIRAFEPDGKIAKNVNSEFNIKICANNIELAQKSEVILLCVKPHLVKVVLNEIKNFLKPETIIISVAAGVSTSKIEDIIKLNIPVIRVMPNTPALVGEGMSALCRGKNCSESDMDFSLNLFSKLGRAIEIEERLINAVTGISGSGPAFMYTIIEALADGGLKLGLKKEIAIELAAQTAIGAAKMILETGKHPSVLKDEVTTPAGCTAEGLYVMQENKISASLINTVIKTAERAERLG